jgi:predicted P-loop ATPase
MEVSTNKQCRSLGDKRFEVIDGGRPTALDAAGQWAEEGYFVVPIAHREKKPVIDGWQNLKLRPEDLLKYFGSFAQNVGLLLGEPHGITDIDLDSHDAMQLWQVFAPPTTCVFGHQSKPSSHFLYHMNPPGPSLKFTDPIDKKTLLELRCLSNDGAVGRQTVIPPSAHKDSGELIRYEHGLDGAPATVDAEVLIRAVKKTAAACVLARHYPPTGGGRHDCELAIAGVLARAGWTEDDAKVFVSAVYTAVPDYDRNALSRVSQAVEDSFRKFAEGSETTGIPKLSGLIDKRAVAAALEWLTIDGGISATVDATNWRDHLIRNERGKILPHVGNAIIALHDKSWQNVLHFNESACRVEAKVGPPWDPSRSVPFIWTDEDDVHTAAWLMQQGIVVPKEIAGQAAQTIAHDYGFHPIREYFNGSTWDGINRIDHWLRIRLGADESAYTQAVGAKFLIGAVARVLAPGCKNDCCLVLEGPQGLYKSTALKVLATPWFTDEVADLGSKDSSMQVHGVLIVEIAELDAMSKSDVSKIKSFMSRAVDRYRPPYGKHLVEAPRESVFAGTVNPGIKYLKDETGGRRFWPVKCGNIDIDGLKQDRDQLWAEAVVRYNDGASWWLDSSELNRAAEQEQAERYDSDPWQERIKAYIENLESVSVAEILELCILKSAKDWAPTDKNRVGRCLRVFGWEDKRVGGRDNRERRFFPTKA